MSDHGTITSYRGGCRCAWCVEAQRAYRARLKRDVPADMPHGAARYNRGCRCDACRAAVSARVLDWQRRTGRRPAQQVAKPRADSARARLERARIGLEGLERESRAG